MMDNKVSHHAQEETLEKAGDNIVKRTASGLKLEPQPSDDANGTLLYSYALIL